MEGKSLAEAETNMDDSTKKLTADISSKFLENSKGLVLRHRFSKREEAYLAFLDLPVISGSQYILSQLPDSHVPVTVDASGSVALTADEMSYLDPGLLGVEKSNPFERFFLGLLGCMNLRRMDLTFEKTPSKEPDFTISRVFSLGGCMGCPHETTLTFDSLDSTIEVGRVEEDFICGKNYLLRCFQSVCCCTSYYDVVEYAQDGSEEEKKKYQLEVGTCCCGPYMNLCGSSPCNPNMSFAMYPTGSLEKLDAEKEPAIVFNKVYGRQGGLESCLRCSCSSNSYILPFPESMSLNVIEKALMLTAVINTEFIHFQRSEVQ